MSAIGQFIYERIAGLAPDPAHPGYKHFFIRPLIGDPLDSIAAELETPYGTAKSGWTKAGGKILIDAVVPPNTTATAILPTDRPANVLKNGKPLRAHNGTVEANASVSIELTPGTYQFQIVGNDKVSQTDAQDKLPPNPIVPPIGG